MSIHRTGRSLPAPVILAIAASSFSLAVASGCAPANPAIRRIDSMVSEIGKMQDGMFAVQARAEPAAAYPEGTEIIARSDSSGVRKIELTAFGEMGKTGEDYYFKNGELAYCVRRVRRYGTPGRQEANGYYFKEDKLVGAIDLVTGKRRPASVKLAPEGPPILERAYSLLRLASGEGP